MTMQSSGRDAEENANSAIEILNLLSTITNVNTFDLVSEAVLSTRSDAIIAADRDGIIDFWNPGAERIFGFISNEAIGHSLDLIIPERLRQRHWDGYHRHSGRTQRGGGRRISSSLHVVLGACRALSRLSCVEEAIRVCLNRAGPARCERLPVCATLRFDPSFPGRFQAAFPRQTNLERRTCARRLSPQSFLRTPCRRCLTRATKAQSL